MISEARGGIAAGMSGSPILTDDRVAVGVVSLSSGSDMGKLHTEGGPQARLMAHLPGWLLKELGA